MNLIEVLRHRKQLTNTGITFIHQSDQEEFLSYNDLYDSALRGLSYLHRFGMKPRDELIFQTEDNKTFIVVYWACILGGIIPVPLTIGQNDEHRQKLFNVWRILNKPYLVGSVIGLNKIGEFAKRFELDEIFTEIKNNFLDENKIIQHPHKGQIYEAREDDVAFIQFSSGSTGNPKGVVLTHRNLITNIKAISITSKYSSIDSMLSWMPLTHDMGLIGFHLNPLFSGMHQYLMPTNLFVRRPALWLTKASEHQISILCSPNFGYKYIIKHCDDLDGYNWDLSVVRLLYNGAEPISEKLCHNFLNRLAKYGLKKKAMCPVYGLAEASLAVSISNLDNEIISVNLDRNKLKVGDAISVLKDGTNSVSFVNVGKPIPDCLLRISNDNDVPVGNEVIGNVQIKGNNVTKGYYNNDQETKNALTKDDWLNTGDLGFIKNDSLYITGRVKDIIFVNGQNFYPHDIERVAESVEGIELNKIAIVGFFNIETEKEETIAFVFHMASMFKFVSVSRELKAVINSKIGFELDRIIPVNDIPRTTSGKLQRFKLLERYKSGLYKETELALNQLIFDSEIESMPLTKPKNEVEKRLLGIWQNVLNNNNIGINQNFLEIGGNSLKAAEVAMLILKEFEVEFSPIMLLENQTIREVATTIQALDKFDYNPIPVTNTNVHYPLGSSQKRLYYAWEMDKLSTAYNNPVALRIVGEINISKIQDCLKQLIQKHDTLKMSFQLSSDPKFRIHSNVDFALKTVKGNVSEIQQKLRSFVKPFDLTQPPLFRAKLLRVENNDSILFLDFHHIISDGVSIYKFIEELSKLYLKQELADAEIQYKDFVHWEKENLTSEKIKMQEKYWLKQFNDKLPLLEMPLDFPRPAIFNTEGGKIEFKLDKETTNRLEALANANSCTLHMLMFALYSLLLSKYSQQQEVMIGIPVTGRAHPDLQSIQGMFVNNLAIKSIVYGKESFIRFLERQKETLILALNNQDYPFGELQDKITEIRNVSRNPVFDTMFIYQNMGFPKISNDDFTFSRYFFDPGFSKFDISMEVFDYGNCLQYAIEYAAGIFKKETVLRISQCFETLIQQVIDNPDCKVSDLLLIKSHEYEQFTKTFNCTNSNYPEDKTIHQLFEQQVIAYPNNLAVECNGEGITYKQLNNRANHIATLLRETGVGPDTVVGLLMPRSTELITGILGVLKSGGCYLPIATDLPDERISYMLKDSKCGILITTTSYNSQITNSLKSKTKEDEFSIININERGHNVQAENIPNVNTSNNLAYIIYTSGTTGGPKGVMIEHKSLINYVNWAAGKYINGKKSTFPLYTSIAFDLTMTSIFIPLITGNTILIYQENDHDQPIERVFADNKVDIVKATPSHLKIIAERKKENTDLNSKIKKIIVGGEVFETRLAKKIYDILGGNVDIYNEYGPTEASVGCMIYKFEANEQSLTVPIGHPIYNTQIYLLDKFLKPVPIGVKGEMYISGDGLARGYLFNEVLTRQKFIPNPFIEGQMMYKSGDIARRLSNEMLSIIGRADQQVKINGFRIEPAEIALHLISHSDVNEAVVATSENKKNEQYLCAYYTGENVVETTILKNYLAGRLPYYMIPVRFIKVESIPLTKNGKIDFQALPNPKLNKTINTNRLPKNAIEGISLKIWEDVLNENDLSIHDNFFELGGDSIKAAQISSRLFTEGIAVNVKDILTYHTIELISRHAEIKNTASKYEQGIVHGERGLTPIELWFFDQNFTNPHYFNQSVLLDLNKKVNIKLLEKTLEQLIKQHDGLRLNYNSKTKRLFYNLNHLQEPFKIQEFDVKSVAERKEIGGQLKGSLNLAHKILIKACVITQKGKKDKLLITAHHMVIDGVSWRILLEDLRTIYTNLENGEKVKLPEKTASLIDQESRMIDYSQSEEIKAETNYWKEVEKVKFGVPYDYVVNDWRVKNSNTLFGTLNIEKTTFILKEAHKTYNTDVPILLNTALLLTLKDWTGLNKFVIEHENHGRHLMGIDTSRTLGWFTTMFPVNLVLFDKPIGQQIIGVKEQMRKVPNHGFGYGIYRYLNEIPIGNKDLLTNIRINYLGQFDKELNNELFSYTNESSGSDADPENEMTIGLELNLMVINGKLNMATTYNKKAHKKLTINWFNDSFFHHLENIMVHINTENDIHFTPSDFDAIDLDNDLLEEIFK